MNALDVYASKLKNAGPTAVGLIYYSGHGIASRGNNYLIPIDVDKPSTRRLRASGVRQSEVLSLLQAEAPNAAHYFVIDACRNELQGARGGKGFVAVNQQAGTLIAFATAPGQTASDIGARGGPYAKALAAELVKPGVSDLLMFHNVRVAVSKATGGDQVPWTLDGIQRGQRLMFGGKQSSAPQAPMSAAARDWLVVKDTKNAVAFRAFARRYKGTVFADMALAMADAINPRKIASVAPVNSDNRGDNSCGDGFSITTDQGVGLVIVRKPSCVKIGQSFKECDKCSEMVVVPAGSFMMGSNKWEPDEEPVHKVTIAKPFAVGKFEVTFAEWDACVAAGGCQLKPEDHGWGRGKRPVINVSWDDITKQFLPWLSRKTGNQYRLLTEAEWEYAARAGTSTMYAFGDTLTKKQAQFSKVSWGSAKQTVEVGKFRANAFGLHDLHGNVWEWVQDCYNNSYRGAPNDGSAVATGKCGRRVLRGGAWDDSPQGLRSADRYWYDPNRRSLNFGFRVVRMLTP